MKPILFDSSATTFTTNGLGRLDAISCIVTEKRNSIYELEMEIAETALHADEIGMGSIIVAKPNQSSDKQAFRVYKMTKPINGKFNVYAQHISYQLSYIPVMPFSVSSASTACRTVLQKLQDYKCVACPFTFSTDVTTVASYKQTVPASMRNLLGGVEGSVLDQFGGEFEWDNYNVILHKNRGITTPNVTLRYGKNITDLNQEENIESTITGLVPFWVDSEGGNLVTLTEKVVDSSYASLYPFKRTVTYDFSQNFEVQPTEAQLRAKAQAYVNQTGIGVPKVSIKLSFVSLADTEEYKEIAALQTVNLCDYVGVYFEKLGISTSAKVITTVYNVLAERYDSIELGEPRSTLYSTISGAMEDIEGITSVTQSMISSNNTTIKDYADDAADNAESAANAYADSVAATAETNAKAYTDDLIADVPTTQQVQALVDNATAWLTGSDGYVIAVKDNSGAWKELIFADHQDPSDWVNVMRINENGIGFSSDGGTTYTQAWTLDGRLVVGGTGAPSLTVYDNNSNILFQVSQNGMMWNATNSSMTTGGLLTASSATLENVTIEGGSLTIENSNNVEIFKITSSGVLTVKDSSNNTIFQVSSSGILWNTTYSSMTANGKLTTDSATLTNATVASSDSSGYGVKITDGVISFLKNSTVGATIKYKRYNANYDELDITGPAIMNFASAGNTGLWISRNGGISISGSGYTYVGDDSSQTTIDGSTIWIRNPYSGNIQSLAYIPYSSSGAPICDFSWSYDSSTGYVNDIYNFDRVSVYC